MNSQEEWYGYWASRWNEAFLDISGMVDGSGINQTMIYTEQQAKALADAAVAAEAKKIEVEEKEPLSEEEKDRLWKAILESCSG